MQIIRSENCNSRLFLPIYGINIQLESKIILQIVDFLVYY